MSERMDVHGTTVRTQEGDADASIPFAAQAQAVNQALNRPKPAEAEHMGRMILLWRGMDPDAAFERSTQEYVGAIRLAQSWQDEGLTLADVERAITQIWPRHYAARKGDGIPHEQQMTKAVRASALALAEPINGADA